MSEKSEKIHGDFSIKVTRSFINFFRFFGIDLLVLKIKRRGIKFRKIPYLKYMGKKVLPKILYFPQDCFKKSEKIPGDLSSQNILLLDKLIGLEKSRTLDLQTAHNSNIRFVFRQYPIHPYYKLQQSTLTLPIKETPTQLAISNQQKVHTHTTGTETVLILLKCA